MYFKYVYDPEIIELNNVIKQINLLFFELLLLF